MNIIRRQIKDLHGKVIELFQENFSDYSVRDEFPNEKNLNGLPAIFVNISDFDSHEEKASTGQVRVDLSWEARVVAEVGSDFSKIEVIATAAQIAKFVDNHDWGNLPGVEPSVFVSSEDENYDRAVPSIEVWNVSWTQPVWIGRSDYDDPAFYPENEGIGYEGVEPLDPFEGIAPLSPSLSRSERDMSQSLENLPRKNLNNLYDQITRKVERGQVPVRRTEVGKVMAEFFTILKEKDPAEVRAWVDSGMRDVREESP